MALGAYVRSHACPCPQCREVYTPHAAPCVVVSERTAPDGRAAGAPGPQEQVNAVRIAFFIDDYLPSVHGVATSTATFRAALERMGH